MLCTGDWHKEDMAMKVKPSAAPTIKTVQAVQKAPVMKVALMPAKNAQKMRNRRVALQKAKSAQKVLAMKAVQNVPALTAMKK